MPPNPAQLEEIARQHIIYEVQNLALWLVPIALPDLGVVPISPNVAVDLKKWIDQNGLEATLVHLRCMHEFLTSKPAANDHSTDVFAAHYFAGDWTPPTVVLGRTKDEQSGIVANINQRLQHISTGRLSDGFIWGEAMKHVPTVLRAFRAFVDDLAKDGDGSRALWFAECFCVMDVTGISQSRRQAPPRPGE